MEIDQFLPKIASMAEEYHLRFVILYGSHARNTSTPKSDMDIAVLGEIPPSFDEINALQNEFDDVFSFQEVDLKSLHDVSPFFRYQVVKDGVLLHGDRHDFSLFQLYAIRRYQDEHQKLYRMRDTLLKRRQKYLETIYHVG